MYNQTNRIDVIIVKNLMQAGITAIENAIEITAKEAGNNLKYVSEALDTERNRCSKLKTTLLNEVIDWEDALSEYELLGYSIEDVLYEDNTPEDFQEEDWAYILLETAKRLPEIVIE